MADQWTLRELAAETGVPERTIRFYISRELLPPPLKGGRGAAYGLKHKTLIGTIKKLQAKGMMLAEIGHALALESSGQVEGGVVSATKSEEPRQMLWFEPDGSLEQGGLVSKTVSLEAEPARALPEPETWRSYSIARDVVVMLRAGASPWRTRSLLSALRRFAAQVEDETKKEDKGE
jgi:DNA-binding transcriptional MerR regulator